jgi:Fe-Mn family superoxide dismutase
MIQCGTDHTNFLAGSVPVLALDRYEHAYHIDFGAKAGAYVDAFIKNIHWNRIGARFGQATWQQDGSTVPSSDAQGSAIAPEDLRNRLDSGEDVFLLDVCLAEDLPKRTDMLPGATIRAPEMIGEWAGLLPTDKPIIIYCIYGFQVSGDAAVELRRRGLDVRMLSGGLAAWHAIGGTTVPLTRTEGR